MEVGVLGPVELRTGTGAPVPVAGARLRTVLVLLALDANRTVSAERLTDGVWGDDRPAAAPNALQALVSRLRRAGVPVEAGTAGYRLALEPEAVDAHRFTRLAGDPATVHAALRLWRGPLEFPEAARADAHRLEAAWLAATKARVTADLHDGAGAGLVAELEELVAAHPLDEPLAALLMRAHAAAGSPGRALRVFADARERLADTLGADPSAELTGLHLKLLRATPDGPKGNLPAEVSSFVGRDADLRAVRELVTAHRLVTLTGPGGSGKTRLSVEAGRSLGADVRDGVWRVELAPVTDPAEVPQAVLGALGLRGQVSLTRGTAPESTTARVAEALSGRELLLVLDNCEHLVGTAAAVADELLRAAPGLRVLATSREPLGIPGERLWPVEPLALPPEGADPADSPAVRLLLDRAVAVRPGFVLDAATTGPVVRICRALDGMPLAIELAAARLRTLPVAVLAGRLDDRFRLLTGGSRTALPRQRTLRAVVDWSWDLLSAPEQALWRRFSIFAGGADVAAVEQVCGADVDLLGALVDKSLLVLAGDRYRMLETIREYGRERLAEAGESEALRRAHAAYLLELARTAEPYLRGADQLAWLRRLGEEHDNLHAAVRAAIGARDAATAVSLTAALGWYWWLRGHRVEGLALTREVLALDGDAPAEDRALAYCFAALNGLEGAAGTAEVKTWFERADTLAGDHPRHPALRMLRPLASVFTRGDQSAFRAIGVLADDEDPWLRAVSRMISAQGRLNFGEDAAVAEAEMRAALDGFRAIGERWGSGFTLSALADQAAARGDFRQAVRHQREAIDLVREVGIREDLPQILVKLAHQLWLAGEPDEARRVLEQARAGADEVAMGEVSASVRYGLATVARADGRFDEALAHLAEAADLIGAASFGLQFHAVIRSTQGLVEAALGDLAAAADRHAEALRIALDTQDFPVIALVLVGLADLRLRRGDPAEAARLLGAAVAVRGSVDHSLPDAARVEAEARAALGDPGFAEAYGKGLSVSVDELDAAAERPDR